MTDAPCCRQKRRWKIEFLVVMKGNMRCLYLYLCLLPRLQLFISILNLCASSIFITFPFTNNKCDPNAITLVNACHSVKLYHFSVVNVPVHKYTHTYVHIRVCYGKKRINKPVCCLQRQLPSCPN